ncbi:MAG: SLC13 family permease, partial [Halanaerobium sp. MSAO_Bac5]
MFNLKEKMLIIFLLILILSSLFTANIFAQDINFENNEELAEAKSELNPSIIFVMLLIAVLVTLFIWEPLPISMLAVLVPITLAVFSNLSQMTVEEA